MSFADYKVNADYLTLRKPAKQVLPKKSEDRYNLAFEKFNQWRTENNMNSFSEDVLRAYFEHHCTFSKPSTMWSLYSMLRVTISANIPGVDIANYTTLKSFIKQKNLGFVQKKATPFTNEQVNTYLNNAPNSRHLLNKIILILGITGPCRRSECKNLKIQDFTDTGTTFIVNVNDAENKRTRRFEVPDKFHSLISSYIALRPAGLQTDEFFLNYQNEKCTRQVVGINRIANVPKEVAKYLNLPNPETYTSDCLRRTAARLDGIDGKKEYVFTRRIHEGWTPYVPEAKDMKQPRTPSMTANARYRRAYIQRKKMRMQNADITVVEKPIISSGTSVPSHESDLPDNEPQAPIVKLEVTDTFITNEFSPPASPSESITYNNEQISSNNSTKSTFDNKHVNFTFNNNYETSRILDFNNCKSVHLTIKLPLK